LRDNFIQCLAETLKWEGGFSNHPDDPGGATNFGVIQERYDEYNKDRGQPAKSVKKITKAEVDDIYKRYYWDKVVADSLPSGVDLVVFDFGVNSGPSRAVKYAQKLVGTDEDGVMGPVTIKAIQELSPDLFIRKYMDQRESYLRGLKTFPVFGKGWLRRTTGIRAKGLSLASTPLHTQQPIPVPKKPEPFSLLEKIIDIILRLFK